MKKSISTEFTPVNVAKTLELLAQTPVKLEALGKSVRGKKRDQPLREGERSLTETLAHLISSEARASEAIYLALLVNEPLIADVHSERDWGKLLRYDLLDFDELVLYFKLRRTIMMRVLNGLNESQWERSIRETGKQRKETVYWQARSLALHEAEHVEDLEYKILDGG